MTGKVLSDAELEVIRHCAEEGLSGSACVLSNLLATVAAHRANAERIAEKLVAAERRLAEMRELARVIRSAEASLRKLVQEIRDIQSRQECPDKEFELQDKVFRARNEAIEQLFELAGKP